MGGFLVTGVLKGHDQLMNLVLDDVVEVLQGLFFFALPSPFPFPLSFLSPLFPPFSLHPFSPHDKKTNRRKKDDEGNSSTRPLGLIVARGTLLVMISPKDGSEEIENPFVTGGG